MTLAGRDLISINDFSNKEIEAVLDLADEMNSSLKEGMRLYLCEGKELYTIFYEPALAPEAPLRRQCTVLAALW